MNLRETMQANADTLRFAARRRATQDDLAADLVPLVKEALESRDFGPVLAEQTIIFLTELGDDGPDDTTTEQDRLAEQTAAALKKSTPDSDVEATALLVATAAMNYATALSVDAGKDGRLLEWVTMHDSKVRHAHEEVDGQRRQGGEPFIVDGYAMPYPGWMGAPIELWINCRCVLRAVEATDAVTAGTEITTEADVVWQGIQQTEHAGGTMTLTTDNTITLAEEPDTEAPEEIIDNTDAGIVPWHGVLAIEGRDSGDSRFFEPNSLTHRVMSDRNGLPLTWQEKSSEAHNDADTIGGIAGMGRASDGRIWGWGWISANAQGDKATGALAEFGKIGVSIDADDAVLSLAEGDEMLRFQYGRICSACMVNIPALSHAWTALGEIPEDILADLTPLTEAEGTVREQAEAAGLSIEEYLGIESSDDETLVASGASEVARQESLHRVRQAFSPDIEMRRGPGWVTNPVATRRIHRYWTQPGQPGYAKIGWGTGGDFNRCRALVGEKIATNSPEDTRFLNQICAQWHHDALGIWPGEHKAALRASVGADDPPLINIVASAERKRPPLDWFSNPNLDRLTPTTITDEGRIFGHIAGWDTCHISSGQYGSDCLTPPHSETEYAYFLTGEVLTDGGPVPCGQITVGGGHANGRKGYSAALAHYDESGTAVADITVGEDAHGIWYSGAIRASATEDDLDTLRAHPLSGDWRLIPRVSEREMIAALCVNSGGFPIPRIGFNNGTQVSLVAAGVVEEEPKEDPVAAIATAVVTEMEARQKRREQMAALMERTKKDH